MEESKKGPAGMTAEKSKALAAALAQIEKQFGKGSVMRLGAGEAVEDIQVVSTGSLGLDIALGVGGLPRGRVVEIYGPESSGKTTLTLQVVAEMQKLGGTAAFIDAEHALDIQYAIEQSTDLVTWTTASSIDEIVATQDNVQTIKAKVAMNGAPRLFLRLRITRS